MSATETTRVEIDDRIREQPDLLRAVNEATGLLTEYSSYAPPPAVASWQFADDRGELLRLTLSGGNDLPVPAVAEEYPTRWILDPINRKICFLQTFGRFLSKRSDARMVRIDRLIARLKKELADGGEDAE
jgi:hypothetical protein